MNAFKQNIFAVGFLALVACTKSPAPQAPEVAQAKPGIAMEVYKSPTCGCCGLWVSHIEDSGFAASIREPSSMDTIKKKLNIPNKMQSCHTAVSAEGYFFEGHIPAKHISAFLANPPKDALGLAVPGMPVGSPGMEIGDRFTPYDVLLLKADGSSEVFAVVSSKEEQF